MNETTDTNPDLTVIKLVFCTPTKVLRATEFTPPPPPPPQFYGGVRVAHLFSFLHCHIMFLYVLSSVWCCPLQFPSK